MAATETKRLRLKTPPFIAMWPNLYRAKKSDFEDNAEAKPKYGLTAVFLPDDFTPADKKLWAALEKALNEKSQEAFGKPFQKLGSNNRGIRLNSDRQTPIPDIPDDAYVVNFTTLSKPGVIHITEGDVSPEDGNEELVYSGMIAQATVGPFSYSTKKAKGVALGLNNIRILLSDDKKAPRRDGRKSASDDFDEDDASEFLSRYASEDDEPSVDDDEEEVAPRKASKPAGKSKNYDL